MIKDNELELPHHTHAERRLYDAWEVENVEVGRVSVELWFSTVWKVIGIQQPAIRSNLRKGKQRITRANGLASASTHPGSS